MRLIVLMIVIFLMTVQPALALAVEPSDRGRWEDQLALATEYVEKQLTGNQVIGGAFGIVYKDQLIHAEGFGIADRQQQALPAKDTVYYAASITKVFTATAILQLHEAGSLDIDQPVQAYLPWFKLRDEGITGELTLRHLLTHSAGGIGSMQTDGLVFAQKHAKDSLETYVRQFQRIGLSEEPGKTGNYCNGCYDVLGLVIEAVTGQNYYDYMQKQVYEPLGMNDTGYGKDLNRFAEERIAKEYSWFFTGRQHLKRSYEEFGAAQDPDGGAYSTIEDLGKFIAYQLGYGPESSTLPMESMAAHREGYVATELGDAMYTASGFELKDIHQSKAFYKTGDGVGSSSVILFVPEYELGVALVLGEMHSEIQLPIAEGVAQIMMGLTPEDVPAALTFGKLIGIVAIILVAISLLLILLFIRGWRSGAIYKKSRVKCWVSLLCWGLCSALLWWLLLGVRPTAMGWFGYPYDLAIGLIIITATCSLYFGYNLLALIVPSHHRRADRRARV